MVIQKDTAETYYKQVKQKIIKKINEGTYLPNEQIPSERELCEIYSVSRTTIRKAIDELVIEGKLIKKSGKGTFVTEKSSEKIKTGNILFVRCIHSHLEKSTSAIKNDIFYPEVLAGVEVGATSYNYHCIFRIINENNFNEEQLEESINNCDGIVCAELHNKTFLEYLQKSGLPVVLICPSIKHNQIDLVEIDNISGAYEAVSYLIKAGHKKIAFIGGSEESLSSKMREQGYIRALNDNDINMNKLYLMSSSWNLEDGYERTVDLLNLNDPPTAIFAASDLLSIGAINAIKDLDLKVPDDISVIGFDNINMSSQIKPALTTMAVRKLEIGKIAVNLLNEKITDKREYPLKIAITAELIKRDTVKS